jgi:hypothetical protein
MRELLPRKRRHGRRGSPHQLNRRNSKPLRGGAIAGLHLGCGQDVHRIHGTRACFKNLLCNKGTALAGAEKGGKKWCFSP